MDNNTAANYLSRNTFGIFSIFINKEIDVVRETQEALANDLVSYKKEVANSLSPLKSIINDVTVSMGAVADYFGDRVSAEQARKYALEEARTEGGTAVIDTRGRIVAKKEPRQDVNFGTILKGLLTNGVVLAAIGTALYQLLPEENKKEIKEMVTGITGAFTDEIDFSKWEEDSKLFAGAVATIAGAGALAMIGSSIAGLMTVIKLLGGTKFIRLIGSPVGAAIAAAAALALLNNQQNPEKEDGQENKPSAASEAVTTVEDGVNADDPEAQTYVKRLNTRSAAPVSKDRVTPVRKGGNVSAIDATKKYGMMDVVGDKPLRNVQAAIFHHTGGDNVSGAVQTLKKRGLSYNYLIKKDGTIVQLLPDGIRGQHAGGSDKVEGVYNYNTIGVAMVAPSNKEITPEQIQAAVLLNQDLAKKYGYDPKNVYGHGEVKSGKQSDEGKVVVDAIRGTGLTAAPSTNIPASTSGQNIGTLSSETSPMARAAARMKRQGSSPTVNNMSSTSNVTKGVAAEQQSYSIPSPYANRPSLGLKAQFN